jgi:DNA-binding MurR/RpiR family transcriptional regulator
MRSGTGIVKDILSDCMEELTPSERQVASILLTDYPVAGMQSITSLASIANVSTPTVVRLAKKLGFDGFSKMQEALREEVAAQIKKPVSKHDSWISDSSSEHISHQFADAVAANLRHTLDRLDQKKFDAVAEILADTSRRIFLVGGRITRSNADYFYNHLQIIRPKITLLSESSNVWPQYILDMDENSVLVIFDIRRYEKDLQKLANLVNERGCTIVLFTDQWGSPIGKHTEYTFKSLVEVPSSLDSTIAITFIVEALLAQIQNQSWESSRDRIENLEEMFGVTKLFRNFSK